jgi:hypothetical protein
LLRLGVKAAADWLTQPDQGGLAAQLERLRRRTDAGERLGAELRDEQLPPSA